MSFRSFINLALMEVYININFELRLSLCYASNILSSHIIIGVSQSYSLCLVLGGVKDSISGRQGGTGLGELGKFGVCALANFFSIQAERLRQSCQRHPGGGILRARRQFNTSHCILPSDRYFTVSSHSVGLLY